MFALPQLLSSPALADVVISRGRVTRHPGGEFSIGNGVGCRLSASETYLHYPLLGTFLVRGGSEVVVDAAQGAAPARLALMLIGPALALVLRQRGALVLHASAVAVRDAAVAFVGWERAGKSTTAAALHLRGHSLVVDDILALHPAQDDIPSVPPGLPLLKLWPDALLALGEDPAALALVDPEVSKRFRPAVLVKAPVPLRRIYVLQAASTVGIEPLGLQEAFVALLGNLYHARLLDRFDEQGKHVALCARLAERVPVRRLRRTDSLDGLDQVARLVEEDVAA